MGTTILPPPLILMFLSLCTMATPLAPLVQELQLIMNQDNAAAPLSFDIKRGSSGVRPKGGNHVISVSFHMSHRPYDMDIYERDCRTPVEDYINVVSDDETISAE